MRLKLIVVFIVVCLSGGCGLLTKEAVLDARDDIENKEYRDALVSLEEIESDLPDLTSNQRAEVYFLKARALYRLDRFEEANNALQIIVSQHADNDFSAQAKVLLEKWRDRY